MLRTQPTRKQIIAEIQNPANNDELDRFLSRYFKPTPEGEQALQDLVYTFRTTVGNTTLTIRYSAKVGAFLATARGTIATTLDNDYFNRYSNYVEIGIGITIGLIASVAEALKESADRAQKRAVSAQLRAKRTNFFQSPESPIEHNVPTYHARQKEERHHSSAREGAHTTPSHTALLISCTVQTDDESDARKAATAPF